MTTKAQKEALAAKIRDDRNVRFWAYSVLIVMLLVSLSANALSATKVSRDPIAIGLAALPPLSLFVTSAMLERIKQTRWYWLGLLVLSVLVSLAFSWVHIAELALFYHQKFLIAWLLPISVDVPMIMAGKVIIDHKAPATLTEQPKQPQEQSNRTSPAKVAQPEKAVTKRATRAIKPIPTES